MCVRGPLFAAWVIISGWARTYPFASIFKLKIDRFLFDLDKRFSQRLFEKLLI